MPSQEESDDDDALLDKDDHDDNDKEMLNKIRGRDWTNFDFSVPSSLYKPHKTRPKKLEWYTALLDKSNVRYMGDWMIAQGDDIEKKSPPTVNLVNIREKLSDWKVFKYKTF